MRTNVSYAVEQLWAPLIAAGEARVVLDRRSRDPEWQRAESYWVVPDPHRASLLIAQGPRRATAGAIGNYSGLRPVRTAVLKRAAAYGARCGIPPSRHTLTVEVRRSTQSDRQLPLAAAAAALGFDSLWAAIGVRTGDNRKPTLALVDWTGRSVGYAKLGWDDVSDGSVRAELAALRAIRGRGDLSRAPHVLAEFDLRGHPVMVIEPLPSGVRGALNPVRRITSRELYDLMPVYRQALPRESAQFDRVRRDLQMLRADPAVVELAAAASAVADEVVRSDVRVPITERWHGDLAPWNRARDQDGTLWLWDWESSEADAVAGLDALHWAHAVRRLTMGSVDSIRLRDCLDDAAPHLVAAGIPRTEWAVIAAIFALTMLERVCALARLRGDWTASWMDRDQLARLIGEADALLGRF